MINIWKFVDNIIHGVKEVPLRYCVDCKYFQAAEDVNFALKQNQEFALCTYKDESNVEGLDLVAPGLRKHGYCSIYRSLDWRCGHAARWFEPKEAKPTQAEIHDPYHKWPT